eukprot:COSAG01_NODE_2814_length_7026_cov_16.232857_3_plen_123_part_00
MISAAALEEDGAVVGLGRTEQWESGNLGPGIPTRRIRGVYRLTACTVYSFTTGILTQLPHRLSSLPMPGVVAAVGALSAVRCPRAPLLHPRTLAPCDLRRSRGEQLAARHHAAAAAALGRRP